MRRKDDIAGCTFGRLRVIEEAGRDKGGHKIYSCECMCGSRITVRAYALRSGNTKSCGCLKGERWRKIIERENEMSGMERALERWKRSME